MALGTTVVLSRQGSLYILVTPSPVWRYQCPWRVGIGGPEWCPNSTASSSGSAVSSWRISVAVVSASTSKQKLIGRRTVGCSCLDRLKDSLV